MKKFSEFYKYFEFNNLMLQYTVLRKFLSLIILTFFNIKLL